ncbi:MAG: chloride channel protein [Ruminococcus sp.]|nr:chloride channel protein [Ruminococcus sp.]MBQ8123294.1 chloride channel protein [Ruminococcus sp.]
MGTILKSLAEEIKREEIAESKSFVKWLAIGSVSGMVIGLVGTLFHLCSSSAEFFRSEHPWLIFLLPLSGAAIQFFYDAMRYSHDKGTNLVLLAVRDNRNMGPRQAACIFIASVITHLFGGSSGREGASLQIGAAIGSFAGRRLSFNEDDRRIMTMCCMAAMFAAVFGTPVTAAIFSMEVISVGIFYYSAIVPCVVSALTASFVSSLFGISKLDLTVMVPEAEPVNYLKTALLGALCALLSVVFCAAMSGTLKTFRKIKNHAVRAAVGGAIVVVLTLIVGDQTYNGTGGAMIVSAFSERPYVGAFAVKLLFTVITLCSGFKGGEIFPVFFIGSSFGSAIAPLFGFDCSMGAAVGMTALFCGVTNCPVASLLLSVELFGGKGLPFFVLASAVSYMLSGYRGLYSEQKILYSKIRPRYINKRIGDKK